MLTFGFALPLSLVLFAVALVDIERAARLRRMTQPAEDAQRE